MAAAVKAKDLVGKLPMSAAVAAKPAQSRKGGKQHRPAGQSPIQQQQQQSPSYAKEPCPASSFYPITVPAEWAMSTQDRSAALAYQLCVWRTRVHFSVALFSGIWWRTKRCTSRPICSTI